MNIRDEWTSDTIGSQRRTEHESADLLDRSIDEAAAAQALASFDPVWEALTPTEQVRLVELLVAHVDYDSVNGKLSITFHPTGIHSFLAAGRFGHRAHRSIVRAELLQAAGRGRAVCENGIPTLVVTTGEPRLEITQFAPIPHGRNGSVGSVGSESIIAHLAKGRY